MRVVYADPLEAVPAANSEHHLCCKNLGNSCGGERDIERSVNEEKKICGIIKGCVVSVLGVRLKSAEDFSGINITCAKGNRIKGEEEFGVYLFIAYFRH